MKIIKWAALFFVPVLALLFSSGEAEARTKRERRTQQRPVTHERRAVQKHVHKKHLAPPVLSVPKIPFLTKEMLTRNDREGVTRRDVYIECMHADDPLLVAFRFFDKDRKGRSILGSNERIAYELCVIDALEVERFSNDAAIARARGKTLFPIESPLIRKHDELPLERFVASSWTRDYLTALAKDMNDELRGEASITLLPVFTVSSIVRSMKKQQRQMNSPARCLFDGDLCSSHTTGSTFDIGLKDYPANEKKILFRLLEEDRKKGIIAWIYERNAGEHCHVFVFPPEFRARFQEVEVKK